jgi:1,4-dihydroxy-2-naphthoate octaprenyltransferase
MPSPTSALSAPARRLPAPGSAGAWLLAARPATLPAAVAPVVVGTGCALVAGAPRAGAAVAALCGALAIQIGTNFANDLGDHRRGADTADRRGPPRAAQAGLLSPAALRRGTAAAFALACGFGLYLAAIAGWPVVAIGAASIAAGLAYTAGPYPLGYHGLGELFVFVFFGLVAVCGTAYVELGAVPPLAWAAALPMGALSAAILVVNNLRDRDTDARAGKRTLAVVLGAGAARAEYLALLLLAYTTPLALVATGGPTWWLLPAASAPLAGSPARAVLDRGAAAGDGAALNRALRATARALLGYALLWALAAIAIAEG